MPHQSDTVPLLDGRVTLYQREDHSSGKWQCRLRLTTKTGMRYKRLSTGKADYDEAKDWALAQYFELKGKADAGVPIFSVKFADVVKSFLTEQKTRMENGDLSEGRYEYQTMVTKAWLVPYFGKMPINGIKRSDIKAFWNWRINFHKSAEGDRRARKHRRQQGQSRRVAVQPKSTTLNEERISLGQIFKHAVEQDWLTPAQMPLIELPVKLSPGKREGFTLEEWKQMFYYIRTTWIDSAPSPQKVFARLRVQIRIYLTINSGLRPPESANLKWGHIRLDEGIVPDRTVTVLWVHGKGKERYVVAPYVVWHWLERWRKICNEHGIKTRPDDYVFVNEEGEQALFDNAIFTNMLKSKGWSKDLRGENRTLYSLRHTYATFKLLYTGIDVLTLAQYMGTSVRMIEAHYADDLKKRKAHIILREKWPRMGAESFIGPQEEEGLPHKKGGMLDMKRFLDQDYMPQ